MEIQPLFKLVGCDAVNGTEVEYEGFVELNFQVPGRNFSEDDLFLVVPLIEYHKEVPAIVGTYVTGGIQFYFSVTTRLKTRCPG